MTTQLRVLVTGASGFVGSAVLRALESDSDFQPIGASREASPSSLRLLSPELGQRADWSELVRGVDVVVHCAARAHVMGEQGMAALPLYRQANVEGTCSLARHAAAAGVRRFVFLSSVKVFGEWSMPGAPFRMVDDPAPADAYALSKLEAERALAVLGRDSGMEVVIIRPPLVYGPGVKANFRTMMRWIDRGIPLPFGAIHNHRSLVALDNLVGLIRLCLVHPSAANQTFLVSDGDDMSTTELLRRMARALGVSPRLLPVPQNVIEVLGRLSGRAQIAQRLCESLHVDCSETRERLGWRPAIDVDEGLARTAAWFRGTQGGRL